MDLDDALEGFKLAMKFTMDLRPDSPVRAGLDAQNSRQLLAVGRATHAFHEWRVEQERRISKHDCDICSSEDPVDFTEIDGLIIDKASVQCLSCGGYFCEYHWIDHLDLSVEELVSNE